MMWRRIAPYCADAPLLRRCVRAVEAAEPVKDQAWREEVLAAAFRAAA